MAPPATTLLVSSNAQQLTVSEIKEDLAAGKTSTGKVVNISLARLNLIMRDMGIKQRKKIRWIGCPLTQIASQIMTTKRREIDEQQS